jgi:ATP-dependent Zn protease
VNLIRSRKSYLKKERSVDGLYNDRKAAYHEAAHAVVAIYNRFPVRSASIDGMGGGTTALAWWHQFVVRFSEEKYTLLYIEYLMAGQAGEMLVRTQGDEHNGSHHDQVRAEHMRMLYQMPRGEFGVMRYRVSGWISDRRELIKMIGERLLLKHKLSGHEIRYIMNDFHKKYPQFTKLTRD